MGIIESLFKQGRPGAHGTEVHPFLNIYSKSHLHRKVHPQIQVDLPEQLFMPKRVILENNVLKHVVRNL